MLGLHCSNRLISLIFVSTCRTSVVASVISHADSCLSRRVSADVVIYATRVVCRRYHRFTGNRAEMLRAVSHVSRKETGLSLRKGVHPLGLFSHSSIQFSLAHIYLARNSGSSWSEHVVRSHACACVRSRRRRLVHGRASGDKEMRTGGVRRDHHVHGVLVL